MDAIPSPTYLPGTGLAAVVDVETTGLQPARHEIIELAILVFAFNRDSGDLLTLVDEYVGLREPSVPIPAAATAVHGITLDTVRGCSLDHAKVRGILHTAEVLIAHNADFDRAFLTALYPELDGRRWLCSMRDIDWRARGFASRSLQALLAAHRIQPNSAHRAGADCHALLALLTQPLPEGGTYLRQLLGRHGLLRQSQFTPASRRRPRDGEALGS